ncbi:hypothetical protein AB1283_05145 [Bacillus sp. S13(2024)]|uniref:hypothetical protein n=1 Tax=unclassified Bacillus (in: firmicutes) TaxID=185979 RepID=UPI003D23DE78
MTSPELKSLIQQQTHFITDLEEIMDSILEKGHVFLYDTSTISYHKKAFYQHKATLFLEHAKDIPILITDVIAKEMRLTEDLEGLYLAYLSKFDTVLYVEERDLYELLKVEYTAAQAKQKFLIASEKAFSCIQPLRESIRKARNTFQIAEKIVFDDYEAFFVNCNHKNHGEMSLACILNQILSKQTITFVGIDQDLYTYVEQCDVDTLAILVRIYRNEERKVIYHNRKSGILHLIRQTEKITNAHFIEKIISNRIQVIY